MIDYMELSRKDLFRVWKFHFINSYISQWRELA